jgi:hypothetical protein
MGMMGALLFFWIFPITGLASLLSYKEIKKSMPWLGRLIDSNERIRAVVQNSLPSVAMISLNALLPFMLEGKCRGFTGYRIFLTTDIAMTYLQGYRARSWIEYSLLKKCVNFTVGPALNSLKISTFPDTSCSSSSTSSLYFCSQVPICNLSVTSQILQQKSLKNWLRHCNGGRQGQCISTDNAFDRLIRSATDTFSFHTSSYKGLESCLFSCSTSELLFPVRSCDYLSLARLEVRSLCCHSRCDTN